MANHAPWSIDFTGLINSLFTSTNNPQSPTSPGSKTKVTRNRRYVYSDDIFTNLSAEDRQRYECAVCLMVARDIRQCANGHVFCSSCIWTWSISPGTSRGSCPVCRTSGQYRPNLELEQKLQQQRVRCLEKDCRWTGILRNYRRHLSSHALSHVTDDITGWLPPISSVAATPRSWRRPEVGISPSRASLDASVATRRQGSRTTSGGTELNSRFGNFGEQLRQRYATIRELYEWQEAERRARLDEVEDIDRRLGEVSRDLRGLLGSMETDQRRYSRYIREANDCLPSLAGMKTNTTSSSRTQGLAKTNNSSSGSDLNYAEPAESDISAENVYRGLKLQTISEIGIKNSVERNEHSKE